MTERRFFFYPANVDKDAAKNSLIEARWMPIYEYSEPVHVLGCTSPERRTCNLLSPTDYHYTVLAERS